MTDYNKWEAKANAAVREVEEDDACVKAESDAALGLKDGPMGPPCVKASEQLQTLKAHSEDKKAIIQKMEGREVNFSYEPQEAPILLQASQVDQKGIRFKDSQGCTFVIPEDACVLKIFVENCESCTLRLEGKLVTSTIEVWKCKDLEIRLSDTLGLLQVDDCAGSVRAVYASKSHVQDIYHQDAPELSVSWGAQTFVIGRHDQKQHVTRPSAEGPDPLSTVEVTRGENKFPLTIPTPMGNKGVLAEQVSSAEIEAQAAQKKELGNAAFRQSDFMQAAAYYTEALNLIDSLHLVLANRSQCWLKLGNHEKALQDATRCTELCPDYAKGWFRKGMSLHAKGLYTKAIPALLEAEKLDPKNKQITEAIKMAQLLARKHNGDKTEA